MEVPDAGYDLSTAGWEVIYPHVSYFDAYSLVRIVERAGWRVEDTGTLFGGMFRFIEFSANADAEPAPGWAADTRAGERARQLAAVAGFQERHEAERKAWRTGSASWSSAGAHPVLWGAGSRGVQFLTFADARPRGWPRWSTSTRANGAATCR